MVDPGSPQLSRAPHTSDRSEAEARIEAALKVALNALDVGPITESISRNNTRAAFSVYRAALSQLVRILEGGRALPLGETNQLTEER